ncbi:MAG TPA: ABC transporter permease [Longimicrobium sp.]
MSGVVAGRESERTLRIEPARGWPGFGARELWSYRDLARWLVWRDLRVRYAQTVLGAAWAVLPPVLTTLLFTVVFGRFVQVPSDGAPYAVFAMAALVPWAYFSAAFSAAGTSTVSSTHLFTKIYFPRLVIPLAPVIGAGVDFAVSLALLLVVMLVAGVYPTPLAIVAVPLLFLLMMVGAAGVGCWLAALNVRFRDVKHLMPLLVQLWMYASPIAYPLSVVPERWRALYALNPMVGVVEGFRTVLLGTGTLTPGVLAASVATSVVLFVTGTAYFRATEHLFADFA